MWCILHIWNQVEYGNRGRRGVPFDTTPGLCLFVPYAIKESDSDFCHTEQVRILAKPNYQFEKRRRDLAKKKKQEEKRQRRLNKTQSDSGDESEEKSDDSTQQE
jgi:hypothetical protein